MTITNNQDPVLEQLTILKRQAEWTGQILLSNPLTAGAGMKILECAEQVSLSYNSPFSPKPVTFYCKQRQCPICQWRRSQRACAEMHQLFDHRPDLAEGKWIFLTLTARNCETWDLRDTLKKMKDAFQRMTRRHFWQENVLGAIRYTEVSVGQSDPNTAHPHFHCLLLVRPSMFAGNNYMSTKRWAAAWGSALQQQYTPRVQVERLQGTPQEIRAQVVNWVGYSTKARRDTPSAPWLITVTQQLKGRQLVQVSGELGTIAPQFNTEDVADVDCTAIGQQGYQGATFRWDYQSRSYYPV
ncbi:protein rep [Marinobacter sp. ATCH36]|uniref:protein rep n=1 Tax=Marinobacter sp. ATCH36 TaxID=2945106 RepID=UPI00201FE9BF|nr:protein rep [Marinobacter sp. ATCH36]MCL7944029.1 protein rep [Marinobacter sp. ATCH36]